MKLTEKAKLVIYDNPNDQFMIKHLNKQAETIEKVTQQLDDIGTVNTNVEVVLARTNEEGVTFESLGNRLNASDKEIIDAKTDSEGNVFSTLAKRMNSITDSVDQKIISKVEKKSIEVNLSDYGEVTNGIDIAPILKKAYSELEKSFKIISPAMGALNGSAILIKLPKGTFKLSENILFLKGTFIIGQGVADTVLEPTEDFKGNCMLTFGSKETDLQTHIAGLKSIGFNLTTNSKIKAFEVFGVRDGSQFKDIMICGNTSTAYEFNMSGKLTMNQGITVNNLNVITGLNIGSEAEKPYVGILDGLFESQVDELKVLGLSSSINNAKGIGIGVKNQCKGTKFNNLSVGNLVNASKDNIGIDVVYADKCFFGANTVEKVSGTGITVGSAIRRVTNCEFLLSRFYNPGSSVEVKIHYDVINANGCSFKTHQVTSKEKAIIFRTNASNCLAEVNSISGSDDAYKSIVTFEGSTTSQCYGNISNCFTIFDKTGILFRSGGSKSTIISTSTGNVIEIKDSSDTTVAKYDGVKFKLFKETEFSTAWDAGNLFRLGNYRLWVNSKNAKLMMKYGVPSSEEDGTIINK